MSVPSTEASEPSAGAAAETATRNETETETGTAATGGRFGLKKVVTLVLSAGLLSWVLVQTDWGEVGRLIRQLSWFGLIAVAATAPLFALVSAWKWRVLLAGRGYRVGLGPLFRMYVIGQFYNNFLPTSAGGDVVRAVMLRRVLKDGPEAVGSIVVERLTGLAVLTLFAAGALVVVRPLWGDRGLVLAAVAGIGFAAAVITMVCLRPATVALGRAVGRVGPLAGALSKIGQAQSALLAYRKHPGTLGAAFAISGVFYGVAVGGTAVACWALGEPVPVGLLLAAVPIVMVVTMLPISFNGLGLWEWSFAAGFAALGSSYELGLAVAVMLRLRDVLWSAGAYAGAVVWRAGDVSAGD